MLVRRCRLNRSTRILVVSVIVAIGIILTWLFLRNREGSHASRPYSRFIGHQPTLVVILAYMRSGSSFLGKMLGSSPDVFYAFEPVGPLYMSMYGTSWTLLSDINFYSNGSKRVVPKMETQRVASFLRNLLTCDFDAMPVEASTHMQVYSGSNCPSNASVEYVDCLSSLNFNSCSSWNMSEYCGWKFGLQPEDRIQMCSQLLSNSDSSDSQPGVSTDLAKDFKNYRSCRKRYQDSVRDRCYSAFQAVCQAKSLRFAKVVRTSMASMEPLLETLPNFRLIHLIRDPRPVALSRMKYPNGVVIAHSAGNDSSTIIREAAMYCDAVAEDVRTRNLLERKYPGKIYTVMYEQLASDNVRYMEEIYAFLGARIHRKTYDLLQSTNSANVRMSGDISWRKKMAVQVNEAILERCREFFEALAMTESKY